MGLLVKLKETENASTSLKNWEGTMEKDFEGLLSFLGKKGKATSPNFKDAKYKGKEIGTATIFLGDLRISTNVIDREGRRATGTRAMKEVGEQVLERGLPWIHRAFVVDDWYITAYEPIRDIKNKIVGMLYVGILENKYVVLKERLVLLFVLGMLAVVLVFPALKFWKKSFWKRFIPVKRKL